MTTTEQMLLCTLLPFNVAAPDWNTTSTAEAAISVNWRNGEIKFSHTSGTLTLLTETLRYQDFLSLLNLPAVKLTAVVQTAVGSGSGLPALIEPLAMRVHLQRDAMQALVAGGLLCSRNFLALESILSTTLGSTPYCIEAPADNRRRRTVWDLTTRTIDITACEEVCEGLYWSFHDRAFLTQRPSPRTLDIQPTVLVSGACDYWQEGLLQNLVSCMQGLGARRKHTLTGSVLVVTERPQPWAAASTSLGLTYCAGDERGVPDSDASVITLTPAALAQQVVAQANLEDAVHQMIQQATSTVRSDVQVRRVIEGLSRKFEHFSLPAGLLSFGLCVLDNVVDLKALGAYDIAVQLPCARQLQVVHDSSATRPKALTKAQVLNVFGPAAGGARYPHAIQALEPHYLIMPLPKHITRRFKVYRHQVKNGLVEERLAKTFKTIHCPLSYAEAIQRFSGRAVPRDVLKRSLEHHFSRLTVSLGDFIAGPQADATAISSDYVYRALDAPNKSCGICFEPVTDDYAFTVCGHTYCLECSTQHFVVEFSQQKSKPCAHCRSLLCVGDVYHAKRFSAQGWSPALASKQQCVHNFVSTLKAAPQWHMSETSEAPTGTRHVIVTDFGVPGLAFEIVRQLWNASNTVGIHLFYGMHESAAAEALAAAL